MCDSGSFHIPGHCPTPEDFAPLALTPVVTPALAPVAPGCEAKGQGGEPVAWAVYDNAGRFALYKREEKIGGNWTAPVRIVPLYERPDAPPSPRAESRDALEKAARALVEDADSGADVGTFRSKLVARGRIEALRALLGEARGGQE